MRDICGRKTRFWIGFYTKGLQADERSFYSGDKKIVSENRQIEFNNIDFFLNLEFKLKDTLLLKCKERDYKIYDFTIQGKRATDSTSHKKITICRVATAKINGAKIPDVRNNILKVTVIR